MELLATLSKINNIEKIIASNINGVIYGSIFSLDYDYTIEEFTKIAKVLDEYGIKKFVVIDQIISEDDKPALYHYTELISSMRFDGIYFHDFAVYEIACEYGLRSKLIYDGLCLMTNSIDPTFLLSKGIEGVVLARELTLNESKKILMNHPNKIDMQIFGRFKMSYSKRKFLSDYFNEIKKDYNPQIQNTLSIEEEKRNYHMPIREREFGTLIYTDYIFEMYEEFLELKEYINRAIVSDVLVDDEIFIKALRDYKRLTKDNIEFIKSSLIDNLNNNILSKGYLYTPTNKEKIDD